MRRSLLLFVVLLLGTWAKSQDLAAVKKFMYYQKWISAENILQPEIKAGNAGPEAAYWMAKIYFENKETDSAAMVLKQFMDKVKDRKNPVREFPLLYAGWGQVLLEQGKTNEARTQFDQIVEETKGKNPEALWAVARANIDSKKGDSAYAIEMLDKALSKDDKSVDYYLAMGDVYRKMSDGSKAVSFYRKALVIDPFKAEAYHKIAKIYKTQNNVSVYVDRFSKAVMVDPLYAPAYYELYYHYYFRDVDMARQNLEKYFEYADPSPEFDYMMTDLLYVSRKYEDAIQKANSILVKQAEKAKPRLYKLIAYSYLSLGDSAKAMDFANEYFKKEASENIVSKDFELKATLLEKFVHDKAGAADWFQQALKAASTQLSAELDKEELYRNTEEIKRNKVDIESYLESLARLDKTAGNRKGEAEWRSQIVQFKENPSNLDIYNWGMALYAAENYQRADSVFAIYEEKYPDQIYGYLWRARCNALIDSNMEQGLAIPHYEKLIEFAEKDSVKYRSHLIRAYGYVGAFEANVEKNYSRSLEYFNKILGLDEGNQDALRYKEILTKWVEEGKGKTDPESSETTGSETQNSNGEN